MDVRRSQIALIIEKLLLKHPKTNFLKNIKNHVGGLKSKNSKDIQVLKVYMIKNGIFEHFKKSDSTK